MLKKNADQCLHQSLYQSLCRGLCSLLILTGPSLAWAASQVHEVDGDTGAETWKTQVHGVTLRLTQILPDQARAFYLNRGFSAEDAEPFATACVYMTVLRNDAVAEGLDFRLAEWRIRVNPENAELRPLKSVDDWMALWQARGLSEPARIAFRWAQFPPDQSYELGEWNQGMLATGLPPGARFDLVARWHVADKTYEGELTDVHCPSH